ncbi:AlpA family phage regulatory protein [Salmonella enterica]|nr:AlpA family phage regulatory protein [Salmonella enterica]EDW5129235.1 AlpA family phage regulatory protein [Salmonella enterica]EHD1618998.1 AlpA family phage regulatory protein [Salmonella enterica]
MATRYIGMKEMCTLTGKSKPTLWRMYAKRKEFPKPEETPSGIFLGWTESVYEEWVNKEKTADI